MMAPLPIVVPLSLPPLSTISVPPLLRLALTTNPLLTSSRPLPVAPVAVPPEKIEQAAGLDGSPPVDTRRQKTPSWPPLLITVPLALPPESTRRAPWLKPQTGADHRRRHGKRRLAGRDQKAAAQEPRSGDAPPVEDPLLHAERAGIRIRRRRGSRKCRCRRRATLSCPPPIDGGADIGAAGEDVFQPAAVYGGGAGNAAEDYLDVAAGLHLGVERPPAGRRGERPRRH